MAATFTVASASESRVRGWAVKLANKARVLLGHHGHQTTFDDAAPARYELEVEAQTSDNYIVILHAVYTVGPKINGAGGGDKPHGPLLLHAKPGAPLRGQVKKLVEGHVRAVVAGMTMRQMCIRGPTTTTFMEEALERAQPDLGKLGLQVYSAHVEGHTVQVPANMAPMAVQQLKAAEARKAAADRELGQALARAKNVAADLQVLLDCARMDKNGNKEFEEAMEESLKTLAFLIDGAAQPVAGERDKMLPPTAEPACMGELPTEG